ncbi:MAG: peptidoglycan-binding protein, partial [Alphaproteobacteria bacterium]|nr:peptidoglycan-binding protein [Alphaproteobacteria bacterium]
MRISALLPLSLSAVLGLAGCSSTELGQGGSIVQGSAGETGNAQGANAALERCNQPLGTVTLDESSVPSHYYATWYGNNTNINSTIPMFRLLAAQSGCFTLVERGAAFEVLERERQLSQSGE